MVTLKVEVHHMVSQVSQVDLFAIMFDCIDLQSINY